MTIKENDSNISSTTIYNAPNISGDTITPSVVRDELLKCFESANREFSKTMTRQKQQEEEQQIESQQSHSNDDNSPPQKYEEQLLKQQVRQFVEDVFQNCGVDFENPKKGGIVMAIEECKKNAEAMMGPAGREIIEHHYSEIMKLVNKL